MAVYGLADGKTINFPCVKNYDTICGK